MHVKATAASMTVHFKTESRIPQEMLKEAKKHYRIFQNIRLDVMEPGCSIPTMTAIKKNGRWKTW
jgi:hypothetical protein